MKAQQVIEAEIERVGKNLDLGSLHDFLRRVVEGLNADKTITVRQKAYIHRQIEWYNTPGANRGLKIVVLEYLKP